MKMFSLRSKQIFSLVLVIIMALAITACKGGGETTTEASSDQTQDINNTINNSETQTDAISENSSISNTSPQSGDSTAPNNNSQVNSENNPTQPSNGIVKPASLNDAVNFCNTAVSKAKSVSGIYNRKLDSAKALSIYDLIKNQHVDKEFDKTNQPIPNAKVYPLNASSVSSYTVTESGNNYIVTFKLKETSGDKSLPYGSGGYMYYITYSEAEALVYTIAHNLGGDNLNITIKPDTFKVTLSGGQIIYTIDKTSGNVSKAELKFNESVHASVTAKISVIPVPGTADLVGHGDGIYTFTN